MAELDILFRCRMSAKSLAKKAPEASAFLTALGDEIQSLRIRLNLQNAADSVVADRSMVNGHG